MFECHEIVVSHTDGELWRAYRNRVIGPGIALPYLIGTGTTLRDAMDELAILLERERQEDDNAPH